MTVIEVISSLGGAITFITALFLAVRAIFRQVNAIEDNTIELQRLCAKCDAFERMVNSHETRISVLEAVSK